MLKRTDNFKSFYFCADLTLCQYKVPTIPNCTECNSEKTLIEIKDSIPHFVCSSCEITEDESDNICEFPF